MQCTLQGHGGSPPRMRGKGRRNGRAFPGNGITPAYAGKSADEETFGYQEAYHPRVCGEKRSCHQPECLRPGSPPRMRGKVSVFSLPPTTFGITPAYAGKSCPFLRRTSPRRDHPRVCGEKLANSGASIYNAGSPPRMRGKVITYQLTPERSGITPAYAGKSVSSCANH